MESAQHTEGPPPSTNSSRPTPRNSQQQSSQGPKSLPPKPGRKPSRRPASDPKNRPASDGSYGEHESDEDAAPRSLSTKTSGSRQPGSRPVKRRPSGYRAPPAPLMPSEDEHLVDPVPLRSSASVRRSAPTRTSQLGENSGYSQASDTDNTSSSSSSSSSPPSFQPFRRPAVRRRTSKDLSLRGPIREMPEEGGELPPGGPDFSTPLPARTKNPRDILNDGERGFIVDLKINLQVDIQIKAKLMGDLTLSVL
ncbi:hypothetical protein CSHISOI_00145 [Colletotrichum shisoi]|uniref:Uncharacterized protein n=1 Tax=Colletotrichum shisoi TaxID=2078593 RepID=A0A5Q4CA53_9PEZI|nr:hypothetical protein CSHISOI_00145 [Colletotrichum shisoi]